MRLAAIEAAASIHTDKARGLLIDLADSDDEELSEMALEAIAIADEAREFYEDLEKEK